MKEPKEGRIIKRFRRNRVKKKIRRRPINVLASVLTTLSLYCGVVSIFSSVAAQYEKAATLILAAIVFDILDGSVARLTKSVSEFGKELDSLSDVVSFGVAPAVLIHTAFLPDATDPASAVGRITSVSAILFVICGALRLARYNVYQSGRRDVFTGLPIPAAGGTVATFVMFARYFDLIGAVWLLSIGALGLSFLMVSNIHYPKDRLKLFVLAPRHAFRMLAITAIGIAAFHYASSRSPAIVLFPLGITYVLFGIVDTLRSRYRRRAEKETPHVEELPEEPPVPSNIEELL